MKTTRFSVNAVTVVASLLAMFTLVAGVSPNEGSTSANVMAAISTTEFSEASLGVNSNPLLSVNTEQDGSMTPNDPMFEKQWALEKMNAATLWNLSKSNGDVLIAILDTGIDSEHEDLQDKVVAEINFTTSPTSDDVYGHGTHVAGIICATANNGVGVAGLVTACKIMNVKVADDSGFCQEATVARGIIWSVDNGAQVINISLEIRKYSVDLEQAVNYAWEHGVLIIAAAGNQGNSSAVYPAYYENCIAVAATRPDDTLAPLSNYGDWVDVAAPGYNIYSTFPNNKYGYETGTSFATAYVSGLAAILLGMVSDMNGNGRLNDEVRTSIENNRRRINYADYNYGIIDAIACVQQNVAVKP